MVAEKSAPILIPAKWRVLCSFDGCRWSERRCELGNTPLTGYDRPRRTANAHLSGGEPHQRGFVIRFRALVSCPIPIPSRSPSRCPSPSSGACLACLACLAYVLCAHGWTCSLRRPNFPSTTAAAAALGNSTSQRWHTVSALFISSSTVRSLRRRHLRAVRVRRHLRAVRVNHGEVVGGCTV
jgi:hypothetical protein